MSRTYSNIATADAKEWLNKLILEENRREPKRYRHVMYRLGELLTEAISTELKGKSVYVICTVEDADFLAMGILHVLAKITLESQIRLACFWNERKKIGIKIPIKVAPIIREYVEPPPSHGIDSVIITKSIISGGCVVHTNLAEILKNIDPQMIYIVAPVVFEGAETSLNSLFPGQIVNKFKYIYFARDSEKDENGIIKPGIGGIVYDLLGFPGQEGKNRYRPALVKTRENLVF